MESARRKQLRDLAEQVLAQLFHDLTPEQKNELATALVRQWLTNDGYAGIISPDQHVWFHLTHKEDGGAQVTQTVSPGRVCGLLRAHGVADQHMPSLLHDLNLLQSVVFEDAAGKQQRLSVIASERTLRVDEMPEEIEA